MRALHWLDDDPLRVMGGEINAVAMPELDGLQLVYLGTRGQPTAMLFTRCQARALAALLNEWAGQEG